MFDVATLTQPMVFRRLPDGGRLRVHPSPDSLMTPRRLVGRRNSTPGRTSDSSRSGSSLPSDLMVQTCRRVGIVSVVFGSVWAFMTVTNNFVLPLLSER